MSKRVFPKSIILCGAQWSRNTTEEELGCFVTPIAERKTSQNPGNAGTAMFDAHPILCNSVGLRNPAETTRLLT